MEGVGRELRVPKRWVKFVVGVFLLPAVWVLGVSFLGCLGQAAVGHRFWLSEEFWFFSLGAVLWLLMALMMPRPMKVYVLGHELTHVLAVWLSGGKVERMRVGHSGGQVVATKINTFIALAPYLVPIYSVMVGVVYVVAGLFVDASPYYRWMLGLLGFTWAFHLSFTCWMIPLRQPDLEYGGQFFSLVVIVLVNVGLLSGLLIAASPEVTLGVFGREVLRNAGEMVEFLGGVVRMLPL